MNLAFVTISRYAGWLALGLLLCALCVTPLTRLIADDARGRRLGRMRRALGIAAACAALAHSAFALTVLGVSPRLVWSWSHLRAGAAASAILLLLLVTSFPRLVRALHLHAWKELHRLVYVAALLALLHILLSPFAPRLPALLVFGCTLCFGLARFLPRREP